MWERNRNPQDRNAKYANFLSLLWNLDGQLPFVSQAAYLRLYTKLGEGIDIRLRTYCKKKKHNNNKTQNLL